LIHCSIIFQAHGSDKMTIKISWLDLKISEDFLFHRYHHIFGELNYWSQNPGARYLSGEMIEINKSLILQKSCQILTRLQMKSLQFRIKAFKMAWDLRFSWQWTSR
jgi:hypothetical protein